MKTKMKTTGLYTMNLLGMLMLAFTLSAEPTAGIKPAGKMKTATELSAKSEAKSFSLSGNIYDLSSSESLAGASIEINGKVCYADLDGNFSIKSETELEGKYLTVSLISYESKQIKLDKAQDKELKIALKQR
jgi:hypothetical protein